MVRATRAAVVPPIHEPDADLSVPAGDAFVFRGLVSFVRHSPKKGRPSWNGLILQRSWNCDVRSLGILPRRRCLTLRGRFCARSLRRLLGGLFRRTLCRRLTLRGCLGARGLRRPLLITLTLHGALVEATEADTGEAAMWEAVKLLIKAGALQAGHALKIERL
jgi:hypothetical protein